MTPMRATTLRAIAAAALLMIAVGSFEPFYFRVFATDRQSFHHRMVALPYTKAPGLREHLLEVRAWTMPGERIAIFPTYAKWSRGYSYVYARSLYLLAGREVLPLVGPDDRIRSADFARADAIAAWNRDPNVRGFTIAARTEHGVLLRRIR